MDYSAFMPHHLSNVSTNLQLLNHIVKCSLQPKNLALAAFQQQRQHIGQGYGFLEDNAHERTSSDNMKKHSNFFFIFFGWANITAGYILLITASKDVSFLLHVQFKINLGSQPLPLYYRYSDTPLFLNFLFKTLMVSILTLKKVAFNK